MIVVGTRSSIGLLDKIKQKIDKGEIRTWKCDSDNRFTHETKDNQWGGAALQANTEAGILRLNIIFLSPKKDVNAQIYGALHGRFVEMLLNHVATDIVEINVAEASSDQLQP